MLEHFKKKYFSTQVEQPAAQAETEKEVVTMTQATEQPIAADNTTADLVAQLAAQTSALTELQASFAELTSKFELAQAALAAADEAKKQLEAEAHTAKMTARKERIVAFAGDTQADALMAATESLDDASFDLIVGAKAAALKTEASSPLFQETGVAAEASSPDVDPVQSLAKAFAEKFNTN